MYFEIEKQAIDAINKALDQYDVEIDRNFKLEFPPNPNLGDLASTIAFALTKKLRTSPPEVAADLVEKIEVPEIFTKVQNFGPYVNFFIDYSKFSKLLLEKVDENYGQLPEYGEKIVLEHTSANPNGPLHIGHIRNSIFGDSLARLLKLAGRDVITQYYVNDMGRQIAIIVCGITECGLKIEDYEGEKIDHKIGKLYFDANKAVEEDEALNAKVDELIQKYEQGEDEELNKVFEDVVSKCISGMKESLSRMNIVHDDFVWEGQFIRNGEVDDLVAYIQKEGFTRESDVLYIDLTDFNIEKEFVLRRSNGTSLYSTRDLAYHKYKATLGDTVLDILGSDHKLAAKQIKIIFEEIFRQTPPEVIFYEFITLPEGSMSTRKGKFVSVDELIDEAVLRAHDEIKSRNPDLSEDEIAHARACKLIAKSGKDVSSLSVDENWTPNEAEQDLVRQIAKFPQVVEDCANKKRVHNITQYSQDLAGSFNKFYKTEQVIGSDVEDTRLILVDRAKTTIKNALDILGVTAPEKM